MCGYFCINCGQYKGEDPSYRIPVSEVPGYCKACGFVNGPIQRECEKCGAKLDTCVDLNAFR